MRITYRWFLESTGVCPEQDDLDRANCKQAGEPLHHLCGWDCDLNLPRWDNRSVVRRFCKTGEVP